MTALAIRDDQTQFDDFQIAVLRQSGVDEDVSNAELAAFLHTCQRRQLDPFASQIYLIGRWDKSKGRKVYKAQTSIDGFRLIARRAADRAGIDYEYEDTLWFDADGNSHQVWLSSEPPAAAKVVVVRNGRRFDATARYAAYVQTNSRGEPSGQWRNMADAMTAKCAESLALRKAFPEDLGGLYTAEEMGQADNSATEHTTVQGHVVRDDAATKTHGNGSGRTAAKVVTDDAWLLDIGQRINAIAGDAAATQGNRLWAEINEKREAGVCAPADVEDLRALIVSCVKAAEAQADAVDGDVVDGQIVDRPGEVTQKQHAHMHALWAQAGFADDRDGRLGFTREIVGREISSSSELTYDEADQVIDRLTSFIRQNNPPEQQPTENAPAGAMEARIAAAATPQDLNTIKTEVMAAFKAQQYDPNTGNRLLRAIKARQAQMEGQAA